MSSWTTYTSVPDIGGQDDDNDLGNAGLNTSRDDDYDASRRTSIPREPLLAHSSSIPLVTHHNHQKSDRPVISSTESYDSTFGKDYSDYSRDFTPLKQLIRLLLFGAFRFIITGVLVGGLYATLWTFEAKPIMDEMQKKLFNFLVTALSMALGINIASSFKNVAIDTRWWFLSRRKRPLKEIDMILSNNSLTTLLKLAMGSVRRPAIMLICLLWIAVNIAAQAGVAMLGLTYSTNPSLDPSSPVLGAVNISNMTQYYFADAVSQTSANQLMAHTYGQMSFNLNWSIISIDQPDLSPVQPLTLVASQGTNYWMADNYGQYVFQQWPAESTTTNGAFYSNRTIIANTTCYVYDVTQGADGDSQQIYYTKNGTMQVVDFQMIEPDSTTYYTSPQDGDCGPRCANVCAFENSGSTGFYHECNITISNVNNATLPEHEIPDEIAKLAAASIALQGYQAKNVANQYQRYPAGVDGGIWQNGSPSGMAYMMTQYAIGAISTADMNNPFVNSTLYTLIPGTGVQLTLDHPGNIHAILVTILAVHLVLFVAGAFLANQVVVMDDSYLAIAHLLRPVVEELGNKGSLLNGDDVCDALGDDVEVVYVSTTKKSTNGLVRHLELADVAPSKSFPAGLYD